MRLPTAPEMRQGTTSLPTTGREVAVHPPLHGEAGSGHPDPWASRHPMTLTPSHLISSTRPGETRTCGQMCQVQQRRGRRLRHGAPRSTAIADTGAGDAGPLASRSCTSACVGVAPTCAGRVQRYPQRGGARFGRRSCVAGAQLHGRVPPGERASLGQGGRARLPLPGVARGRPSGLTETMRLPLAWPGGGRGYQAGAGDCRPSAKDPACEPEGTSRSHPSWPRS